MERNGLASSSFGLRAQRNGVLLVGLETQEC